MFDQYLILYLQIAQWVKQLPQLPATTTVHECEAFAGHGEQISEAEVEQRSQEVSKVKEEGHCFSHGVRQFRCNVLHSFISGKCDLLWL